MSTRSASAPSGCGAEDAEDVFQDVFAKTWAELPRLRDDAAIRPWLGQLTRRTCIDRLRSARPTVDAEEAEIPDPADDLGGDRARARRPSVPRRDRRDVQRDPRPLLRPRRELPDDRRGTRAARRHDRKPHLALSRQAEGGDGRSQAPPDRPVRRVIRMRRYEIEELAQLIALLPPVPGGWVEAAQELPRVRAGLDALIARARRMPSSGPAILADLETAFADSDIQPTPRLLDEARRRLRELTRDGGRSEPRDRGGSRDTRIARACGCVRLRCCARRRARRRGRRQGRASLRPPRPRRPGDASLQRRLTALAKHDADALAEARRLLGRRRRGRDFELGRGAAPRDVRAGHDRRDVRRRRLLAADERNRCSPITGPTSRRPRRSPPAPRTPPRISSRSISPPRPTTTTSSRRAQRPQRRPTLSPDSLLFSIDAMSAEPDEHAGARTPTCRRGRCHATPSTGSSLPNPLPQRVDRDWAFGGATGAGVRVCILDSGVESGIRSSARSPVRS